MSDTVMIALLVAIPPTLVALAGLVNSIRNGGKLAQHAATLQAVHLQINSRMDELLAISKRAAHAEGVIEGKEGEKGKTEGKTMRLGDKETGSPSV